MTLAYNLVFHAVILCILIAACAAFGVAHKTIALVVAGYVPTAIICSAISVWKDHR